MNLTYDALGRMVEENMGSNYDEFDFTPTGAKLAFMSGQTLVKAFVSLPGGAQAVYTSSGLAYYRHKDWLGSSRLASTPTRTTFSDTALAPYGEAYAQSGTTDLNFTGMNQDVASGVYDFPAREYGAVSGRWPSPDPAGLASVHPRNPQSWNRYAYVQNDPSSLTDPQGLDCVYDNADGTVTVYEGDCLSDTDSGVYVDCDGCLTTSAGVTITQDNYGNETLTDSAGDVFSIGEAGFDPGTYFTPEGVLLNQMNQINQLMQQMPPPGALPESLLDAMIQDGSINILQQTGAMLNDPLFYAGWYALPAAAEGCAATGGSQCVAVGLLGTIVTNFVLNSYEQYELGPPVHVPGAEPVGPSNPPEQPPISGPGPQGPDPLPTAP